jgi:hypothetical protein
MSPLLLKVSLGVADAFGPHRGGTCGGTRAVWWCDHASLGGLLCCVNAPISSVILSIVSLVTAMASTARVQVVAKEGVKALEVESKATKATLASAQTGKAQSTPM